MKQIKNKQEIIKNAEFKDETGDLLSKLNKIKLEGDKLNKEKTEELKKYGKFKLNKEETITSLKLDLKKLNIYLVE